MTSSDTKTGKDEEITSTKVHDHDILGSTKDASESAEQSHLIALTEDELALEKKLRWKIDLMIMPLIIWTYLMNYIDRLVAQNG